MDRTIFVTIHKHHEVREKELLIDLRHTSENIYNILSPHHFHCYIKHDVDEVENMAPTIALLFKAFKIVGKKEFDPSKANGILKYSSYRPDLVLTNKTRIMTKFGVIDENDTKTLFKRMYTLQLEKYCMELIDGIVKVIKQDEIEIVYLLSHSPNTTASCYGFEDILEEFISELLEK